MKDIRELPVHNIKAVLFDIDDTFSSEGKITAPAYNALWRLHDAGIATIPVTGRPAGWCDHIARMWPVTAVIGENGALYFMMRSGKMERHYIASKEERAQNAANLAKIREEIFAKHPNAGLASDQTYREFDLAIDFCEDVPPLSKEAINDIVAIFKYHGATVKISSIHVNGWFGQYDKLSTAKIFAKRELGIDLDKDNDKFVFAGDSPNDEPMFGFFNNSVGVANVMNFANDIKNMPKFVTKGKSGVGFEELANIILNGQK